MPASDLRDLQAGLDLDLNILYSVHMETVSKQELRRRQPEIFESLAVGPVEVTSYGRPVAVLVSAREYSRLRGRAADAARVPAVTGLSQGYPPGDFDF